MRRQEMKIAISGSTGFIGTQLSHTLTNKGHVVVPIGRGDFQTTGKRSFTPPPWSDRSPRRYSIGG
jgi:nucleoside-diphosphate-sugar epimerase